MKLIVLIVALAVARSAKLDRTYLPPLGESNSDGSGLLETPKFSGTENSFGRNNDYNQGFNLEAAEINNSNSFNADASKDENDLEEISRQERPQATYERNAATNREENEKNGDAFSYLFETENGIFAEESGIAANGVQAQGGYSYTGDDGQVYSIRYTADENGFVPQGNHLPTAPPIPEEILRALEQNARDEAAGIFDDGSYDESKYNEEYAHQYVQSDQGPGFQSGVEGSFASQNDANTIATQAAAYLPPREQFQRKPAERFESNGNKIPAIDSTNERDMNGAERQTAYIPPLSSSSRPRGSHTLPLITQSIPNDSGSHSENLHRPSSYEVPLQSRIPEEGLDASSFESTIQKGPRRPSFNSRTGYNY